MKKSILILAVAAAIFLAQTVDAGHVGVTLKGGTLGYGGDVTINCGPVLNMRGGFNMFNYEESMDMDEAVLTGSLEWQTIPILLDIHPMKGGFRISIGPVINNNEISLSANPLEPLELEGTPYTIDGLDGTVSFQQLAYYFGIGYGNAVGEGRVHFACDFGLMYHGEPEMDVSVNATLPAAEMAQLEQDLEIERGQLENDLSAFVIWPVVSVGISISF